MFMQKEITGKEYGYAIHTTQGTWFVPSSVCGYFGADACVDYLQDYVEPTIQDTDEIELVCGYFGRMSAPGYLDCTDWKFSSTKKGINDELRTYC